MEECDTCAEDTIFDAECENRCTEQTPEKCDVCKTELGAADCERTCLSIYNVTLDEVCMDSDYNYQMHRERQDDWLARTNQSKNGAFVPHDKVRPLL